MGIGLGIGLEVNVMVGGCDVMVGGCDLGLNISSVISLSRRSCTKFTLL